MRRRHPDEGVEKKGKAVVTRRTPHLLDEIVEQILLTHPASSLLQLRSVCRSWRTLISSSRFTNEHLRRSIFLDPTLTHPRIAYYSFPCKYPTIGVFSVRSLSDNKPTKVASFKAPRYFTIYGSCNGLLCLVHETRTGVNTCILWNLCTGSTSEPAQKITGGFSFYGLGYDHMSDRYKLIGYLQSEESRIYSTRIYTFAPNSSWRTIPIEDDVDFTLLGHPPNKCPVYDCNNMEGVFVSNTLNWIVDRYRRSDVVLSFDLGKETYCYLPLPERDPEDDLCLSVVSVLRNCLAACFEYKRTHWAVWLMKEYGVTQSWTRLALIPPPSGL
ncbi:hypothetical protein PIB30_033414 [Stylosanthes scabra]|uniref:F-box domain-containing protein n=1 Tax=Stylosanthes scabra TaxID=79078 RepID=A0ABU6RCN3_9FABA|nr:hypothetical protein [Stylosanthes scabra]